MALTKNDTGGEVFERIEVARAKPLGHLKRRRTGHQKPTSAIAVNLAGSQSAHLTDSPPVSKLRESRLP